MRGRIHAQNDVINGISGMEHLSNSLAKPNNVTASPQIMAQMRPSPYQYQHHGSMPEYALAPQLANMNISGGATPMMAKNATNLTAGAMNLKSSQSRGNLPSMPELEYDPWHAN